MLLHHSWDFGDHFAGFCLVNLTLSRPRDPKSHKEVNLFAIHRYRVLFPNSHDHKSYGKHSPFESNIKMCTGIERFDRNLEFESFLKYLNYWLLDNCCLLWGGNFFQLLDLKFQCKRKKGRDRTKQPAKRGVMRSFAFRMVDLRPLQMFVVIVQNSR